MAPMLLAYTNLIWSPFYLYDPNLFSRTCYCSFLLQLIEPFFSFPYICSRLLLLLLLLIAYLCVFCFRLQSMIDTLNLIFTLWNFIVECRIVDASYTNTLHLCIWIVDSSFLHIWSSMKPEPHFAPVGPRREAHFAPLVMTQKTFMF